MSENTRDLQAALSSHNSTKIFNKLNTELHPIDKTATTMESWLRSECTCKSTPSPLSSSSCKPQNRYLCYLLDEFEKCSQQSGDLTKLQKVKAFSIVNHNYNTVCSIFFDLLNSTDKTASGDLFFQYFFC